VAQAFVIITSDLYLLFTSLSDTGLDQIAWLTYPVVWTINHVLELIFVVVTCTRTSKTANQTAVVVHKLLAKDCDPELRNQVRLIAPDRKCLGNLKYLCNLLHNYFLEGVDFTYVFQHNGLFCLLFLVETFFDSTVA